MCLKDRKKEKKEKRYINEEQNHICSRLTYTLKTDRDKKRTREKKRQLLPKYIITGL